RGAGEIPFPAQTHPVLPVAIERRDRALPFLQRVRPLAETGPAPRLADLAADRSKDIGDRLACQPRIRTLDLPADAARAREDHEVGRRARRAMLPRRADPAPRLPRSLVAPTPS